MKLNTLFWNQKPDGSLYTCNVIITESPKYQQRKGLPYTVQYVGYTTSHLMRKEDILDYSVYELIDNLGYLSESDRLNKNTRFDKVNSA
jgi:hypothetical protein